MAAIPNTSKLAGALPAAVGTREARRLRPTSFVIEPFDLFLHSDEKALYQLQNRIATLFGSFDGPVRIATWHMPSSLRPLIDWTIEEAATTEDPWRRAVLMEYRQWYEEMERTNTFQQAVCGITFWTEGDMSAQSLGMLTHSTLGTRVIPSPWPPLMYNEYHIKARPIWHLSPVGRPSGRPVVCLLGTFEFKKVEWNFFRPLGQLFALDIPIAVIVDVPKTWEPHKAVSHIEGVITATNVHIVTSKGIDTTSQRQIRDCADTIDDIHNGQNLHEVQIKIAVFADSAEELKKRVSDVKSRMKPFMGLRVEVGPDQKKAARYFSTMPTSKLDGTPTIWPMTSKTAALAVGFLGVQKLQPRPGIIRGESVGGGYPYIYDDWDMRSGKKATHECWVGQTGSGKTFALNGFLARSKAHHGIAFDLLEPMGHGRLLAQAFNIEPFTLSARRTVLNPHDPVYARLGEQIAHVIGLYETILQRHLAGDPVSNLQRSLLSQALYRHYQGFDLTTMTPADAPLVEDVVQTLFDIGGKSESGRIQEIARELGEEIGGLASGTGPFGHFLNGKTNIDLSIAHEHNPRIFCFDEIEDDDVLVAIAYTQVLAAIMRTALSNDTPRIIAVDEVYRMMRHPSLLDFLIIAVKVLRTRRKKVIVIDQQLRIFLSDPKTRLLFENCPIKVIFNQRGGEDIFWSDPAFSHLTDQHRKILAELPRFHFMMETDEGLFYLKSTPSRAELRRYGTS